MQHRYQRPRHHPLRLATSTISTARADRRQRLHIKDQQGPETGLALVSCLGETGGSLEAAAHWRIPVPSQRIHFVG